MTAVTRRLLPFVALAAALTLVAGCDSAPTEAPQSTSAKPQSDVPPPLVPAMALPDGAVDNAVAKLDGMVQDLLDKTGIPGMAVAVVHGGKTVYAKGFGVTDVRTGAKVDPDTVFQLASLSKPLGATVVAHQVGQGAVGWDTPIVSKLPWFALSDPAVTQMVTVGDLYSHRSGLPDHAGDLLEDVGYDRRAILERLRQLPLAPFRDSYAYTNFGLTAAAEAVATAAGKPWETLSEEVLYRPLGMTSTSSRFADYEKRPDRAVGHIHVDGRYEPSYIRNADAEGPAGGVSSSANDVAKWLAMVLADGKAGGDQLVDSEALLPALTPQSVSSPASEPAMRTGFYGFGFNVGTSSAARVELSHSGAFELGAGTNFLILPSADVAIVALTNATPAGVPETLTAQFADLVQFGEVREDWYGLYNAAFVAMEKPLGSLVGKQAPANPAPSAPPASLAGVYNNDFWGPATVTEAGGSLGLQVGPGGDVWPLTHWDGNVFTFSFVSENSPPGSVSKATFDGNRLTLEYFDEEHNGVFVR
ncbi:serine hydrolase [Mycolicibacterium litorale]|uniref:serine hydrolase n=1 Tax=Mycolicibacterium litorale TaxID=758802 RepID=UPI0010656B0F|nr:serine hydrolase [Mycolicibacterium litorale]MCV7418355.1 serine hydrolase [Mycolicibacterium litorale]TDY06250.1 CubicO group peptidase (beta-lactamase class C family) [Mycolicibacterium litorale]